MEKEWIDRRSRWSEERMNKTVEHTNTGRLENISQARNWKKYKGYNIKVCFFKILLFKNAFSCLHFFCCFFLPCMCGGQKFSLIFFSSSASSKDKWASNVVVVIVTKNHQRSKVESCIERKKIHMATNAVTFDMSQAIKLMILFHADIFYFITINSNCIRPKWGV